MGIPAHPNPPKSRTQHSSYSLNHPKTDNSPYELLKSNGLSEAENELFQRKKIVEEEQMR
jgi:hypothetical protein